VYNVNCDDGTISDMALQYLECTETQKAVIMTWIFSLALAWAEFW
jgi:hypothetical protein